MREDTATENGLEVGVHGESPTAAEPGPGALERRPSLVMLQLKKVSQSPFHNQFKNLASSTSDSSGSYASKSQNKQDWEPLGGPSPAANGATSKNHPLLHLEQNGGRGDSAKTNPFYTYFLESSSKGHKTDDGKRREPSEFLSGIFVPLPEYQNSHLDLDTEVKTQQNGANFPEPQKDPFQALTSNHMQGHLQTATLPQNKTDNFSNITVNSPDLFKVSLHAEPMVEGNPFRTSPFMSPSNKVDELFQSPKPVETNPFHTATSNGADFFQALPTKNLELFKKMEIKQYPPMKDDHSDVSFTKKMDIFSPSSADKSNPFSSTITRDLFQDFSNSDDPYGTTPSKHYDPFGDASNGTPDIFQPFPSKTNSMDIFDIAPSKVASMVTYPTLSLDSPLEMKKDLRPSSPDFFKETPSNSAPTDRTESPDGPLDFVLTTPQGTKHNILRPTPFTRARNLSMSPGQSSTEMTHVSTFKRPPRPLPRIRPPGKEKSPVPERPTAPAKLIEPEPTVPKTSLKPALRPLPKPVVRHKPKTLESKPVDPDNYVVFQDVLLIGQEKCVEDWPEDSPELDPNFKPSGTLKLRRESLKMKAESDGGSGEDPDGSGSQKKDKKFKMSLLSRRGSKDKFPDDTKEGKTLPARSKSSKESFPDLHMSAGENDDGEHYVMEYIKKKPLKTKVNQLLRRASTNSSLPERKHMNGLQESKDDELNKKSISKQESFRRWSEGTVLDDSTDEEEGEAQHQEAESNGFKKKKKVKIRSVPQRGFAITVDKELKGAHGYTPRKGSKDDALDCVEKLKGQSLHSTSKAAFIEDERFHKTLHTSAGLNGDDPYGMEDCKPKKPSKMKLLHVGRRSSKEDMLYSTSPESKNSSFSVEELDNDELNRMEDFKKKKPKRKGLIHTPHKSKTVNDQSEPGTFSPSIAQQTSNETFMSPGEMYDYDEDEPQFYKLKKLSKLKGLKRHKAKSKAMNLEDPPGAASSDYMSEAAKAEWLAAQLDERAMAGLEDEDEEGDTDSLMEWWYTVEQWDELPSDEEDKDLREDESKSFTILANKVHCGLRVFNKAFTERAEVLWQSIIKLHTIADNISKFHQKAKIAGITGGTTTAVGGAAAIAGLALAPFTFGASLVVTAVGVGVATAGGITSASAAISDNINNMHDRKKVETVLQEYEGHLLDIGKILHFVNQGLYKLRGHPFLRSGTQHYSEDWEIRKAVQMVSLVDTPVMRAVEITDSAVASVQGLFKGMDKYFLKDSRELKKGCKKEVVGQIKEVANVLNDAIVSLNAIREELHDATGNI